MQGWNGFGLFAYERDLKEYAELETDFVQRDYGGAVELHSYQLEKDELLNESGLPNDLYLFKPSKRFEGSWIINDITDPGTTQMQV